jgi:hypothetical protein
MVRMATKSAMQTNTLFRSNSHQKECHSRSIFVSIRFAVCFKETEFRENLWGIVMHLQDQNEGRYDRGCRNPTSFSVFLFCPSHLLSLQSLNGCTPMWFKRDSGRWSCLCFCAGHQVAEFVLLHASLWLSHFWCHQEVSNGWLFDSSSSFTPCARIGGQSCVTEVWRNSLGEDTSTTPS